MRVWRTTAETLAPRLIQTLTSFFMTDTSAATAAPPPPHGPTLLSLAHTALQHASVEDGRSWVVWQPRGWVCNGLIGAGATVYLTELGMATPLRNVLASLSVDDKQGAVLRG